MENLEETKRLAGKFADDIERFIVQPGTVLGHAFQGGEGPLSECGFILVQITLSMVELAGELIRGAIAEMGGRKSDSELKTHFGQESYCGSKELFVAGFCFLHSDHEADAAEKMYSRIRCGSMHSVFPKGDISLDRNAEYGLSRQRDLQDRFLVHPAKWFYEVQGKVVGLLRRVQSGNGTPDEMTNVCRRLRIMAWSGSLGSSITSMTQSTGTTPPPEGMSTFPRTEALGVRSNAGVDSGHSVESPGCPPFSTFDGQMWQNVNGCWLLTTLNGSDCG
jgi:hypothetical protein